MTTESLQKQINEIKILMKYAVLPDQLDDATTLLEKHNQDEIGLNIFHHFYSYLPEGEEDRIKLLRLLARKEGTFLICASTNLGDYLFLATSERAEFLGNLKEGIWEEEVLDFFDHNDRESFITKHADLSKFPVYVPALLHNDLCPVCHTADGELHNFGCPVEICPWCDGQLAACECRFKKLDTERFSKEKQLENLLEKINKKGRVPFNAEEHRPSYPLTPEDLK